MTEKSHSLLVVDAVGHSSPAEGLQEVLRRVELAEIGPVDEEVVVDVTRKSVGNVHKVLRKKSDKVGFAGNVLIDGTGHDPRKIGSELAAPTVERREKVDAELDG